MRSHPSNPLKCNYMCGGLANQQYLETWACKEVRRKYQSKRMRFSHPTEDVEVCAHAMGGLRWVDK